MKVDQSCKILEEEREYLCEWLANLGSAQELAPEIQRKLEQIEWEISALNNSPEEAEEIPSPKLNIEIDRDRRFLSRSLPMIPPYKSFVFSSSDAIGTTSSASVFEYVTRVGDLGTSNAQGYSETFTKRYYELEISQKRPDDIRRLLDILGFRQTLERFEEAYKGFYSYKGGVRDKKAVALFMRNFLDGVQGDLFNKARTQPKENMTWKSMANRLSTKINGEEENII